MTQTPPSHPGYPGYPPPAGYQIPPARPPVAPNGARLADFGERLLAFFIDAVILFGVTFVVYIPVAIAWFTVFVPDLDAATRDDHAEPADVLRFILAGFAIVAAAIVLVLALHYVYRVEMMFRTGQTVGKRVMNLRTVPLDPAGTLTRAAAARRFLVQDVAASFVPFFAYVDGFWQLWDQPYRQCLHDKFAKTVVVKV